MSINVTVTGNPVSIKRGKMVTATEPEHSRNDFQKRRKLRMEQVRQQSREIAQSVRTKVKKGRSDQQSLAEKESETKLLEWQNKKLLNLQNQYEECLKEIGVGHTDAAMLEKEELEELIYNEQQNNIKAKKRGISANDKNSLDKFEKQLKDSKDIEKKRQIREIENTRAAMISKSKNNKYDKKQVAANINISKEIAEDSEDSYDDVLVNITEIDSDSESVSEADCQQYSAYKTYSNQRNNTPKSPISARVKKSNKKRGDNSPDRERNRSPYNKAREKISKNKKREDRSPNPQNKCDDRCPALNKLLSTKNGDKRRTKSPNESSDSSDDDLNNRRRRNGNRSKSPNDKRTNRVRSPYEPQKKRVKSPASPKRRVSESPKRGRPGSPKESPKKSRKDQEKKITRSLSNDSFYNDHGNRKADSPKNLSSRLQDEYKQITAKGIQKDKRISDRIKSRTQHPDEEEIADDSGHYYHYKTHDKMRGIDSEERFYQHSKIWDTDVTDTQVKHDKYATDMHGKQQKYATDMQKKQQGSDKYASDKQGKQRGIDKYAADVHGKQRGSDKYAQDKQRENDTNASDMHGKQRGSDKYATDMHGKQRGSDKYATDMHEKQRGSDKYATDMHGKQQGSDKYATDMHGKQRGNDKYVADVHGKERGNDKYAQNKQRENDKASDMHGKQRGIDKYATDMYGKQRIQSKQGKNKNAPERQNETEVSTCSCGHPLNEKCDCDLSAWKNDYRQLSEQRLKSKVPNRVEGDSQLIITDTDQPSGQNRSKQTRQRSKSPMKQLPQVPTTSVRTASAKAPSSGSFSKVKQYDHTNRFSQEYITDNSNVHKHSASSIEVVADNSEDNLVDTQHRVFQREQDANVRGQRALEKERIHRSNVDVLGRLKHLQPRERIASINPANGQVHLSEDRLKERDNKRQNVIENAFETLFPNTITIPTKHHQSNTNEVPFKAVSITASKEAINASKWDASVDKTEDLRELLKKLKGHKSDLLKEVDVNTHSSLSRLINELESAVHVANKPTQSSSSSLETCTPKKTKIKTPKRHKTKRSDVLILQNMSTQTSPNNAPIDKPDIKSSVKAKPELKRKAPKHVSVDETTDKKLVEILAPPCKCACGKCTVPQQQRSHITTKTRQNNKSSVGDTREICEILIKLNNKEPAIIVKAPKDIDTQLTYETTMPNSTNSDTQITQESTKEIKSAPMRKTLKSPAVNIIKRNGVPKKSIKFDTPKDSTNSSTSYYSPPNYSKNETTTSTDVSDKEMRGHLAHLLKKKPQQGNVSKERLIQPQLLDYIKQLLNMTQGVDLGVTSVSDVSTPNSSVVNVEANQPLDQLTEVLKYFNLEVSDVQASLDANYNQLKETRSVNEDSKSECPPSINEASTSQNTTSKSSQPPKCNQSQDGREMSQKYPNIVNTYSEFAGNCLKRITNLEQMIEKVRSEKNQMLSPNHSDREVSTTQYLNLPTNFGEDTNTASDVSTSPEQRKLTAQLLKLNEDAIKSNADDGNNVLTSSNPLEADLIKRYLSLKHDVEEENITQMAIDNVDPPILLNIPKLPQLTTIPESYEPQTHKRPPPAKGLSTAKRYNEQITAIPHELSTIVEGDSRNRSKSPDGFASPKTSPVKDSIPKNIPDIIVTKATPMLNKYEKQTLMKNKDVLEAIKRAHELSTSESSDKSELDIETMLKTMGMGWAIATLRKTQEALAKSSSTSSFNNSTPPTSEHSSEVSLKNFLRTIKTGNDSASPFSREFPDVSAIQGNSRLSVEKQQRTSTPVQATKSAENSKSGENTKNADNTRSRTDSSNSTKKDVSTDVSTLHSHEKSDKSEQFASLPGCNMSIDNENTCGCYSD